MKVELKTIEWVASDWKRYKVWVPKGVLPNTVVEYEVVDDATSHRYAMLMSTDVEESLRFFHGLEKGSRNYQRAWEFAHQYELGSEGKAVRVVVGYSFKWDNPNVTIDFR